VAVDPSGNVYIADRSANHIVKVTPWGAASLVSIAGFTLASPQGIAADGAGNLYVVDSGHRRIVQVTAAGTASVVQTPGQTLGTTMFGVTVDANGNIFAADWSNNRVVRVDVTGAALSFASAAIGSASSDSPKTATVTNLGTEALNFRDNPSYTTEFAENSSDLAPCTSSTSLNPGEVCDVSVSFTPQSVGSRSATLVVTNNHLNGTDVTQNIAVTGTGAKASPSITLRSSANPAPVSTNITFTATVSSSVSTPTGSVDFYDGSTLVGSAILVSGTATYAIASLTSGAHSITAVYAGDSSFLAVTSSAVSVTVTDLTLDIASGGTSTATVSAGGTATYHLTIAPSSGSALPDVTLSATGAPGGSTVTITPSAIAAGAPATNVTLTVQVPAHSAAFKRSNAWALGFVLPLLGLLIVPVKIGGRRIAGVWVCSAGLLLFTLVSVSVMTACGSNSSSPAPPASNYTMSVTATSGSVAHATTLTLTVL